MHGLREPSLLDPVPARNLLSASAVGCGSSALRWLAVRCQQLSCLKEAFFCMGVSVVSKASVVGFLSVAAAHCSPAHRTCCVEHTATQHSTAQHAENNATPYSQPLCRMYIAPLESRRLYFPFLPESLPQPDLTNEHRLTHTRAHIPEYGKPVFTPWFVFFAEKDRRRRQQRRRQQRLHRRIVGWGIRGESGRPPPSPSPRRGTPDRRAP